MLSELRNKNKQLKIKLRKLREDSDRIYKGNQNAILELNSMDNSRPINSSSSRYTSYDDTMSSRNASAPRYNSLCDKAKVIRGEASKRIEGLLHEWKDYKEKADEDIRRRTRSEQSVRDLLNHKEREVDELTHELLNLRSICEDQRQTMERTTRDRETEAKCRARCVELESQISKLSCFKSELQSELQVCTDIIKSIETERESLIHVNAELRQVNAEQKRKLEICEHDVTETRMELEILEDMVRALNERKTAILSNKSSNDYLMSTRINESPRSNAPDAPTSPNALSRTSVDQVQFDESIVAKSPQNKSNTNKNAETVNTQTSATLFAEDDSSREVTDRKSAMSALKSLQKEHAEKCNYLAEHIKKLKNENKIKEHTITELQTKKNPPIHKR